MCNLYEKINNILLLSSNDKSILLQSFTTNNIELCKNMSIFSEKGHYKTLDNYNYFETNDNENVYYINMHYSTQLSLFVDNNKKILYYSRYFFDKSCFSHFIDNIDFILKLLNDISLINDSTDIGNNIISIQKWFITYGHYKDEIFNLCDFYNKINTINTNYTILLDYHTDNNVTTYPVNLNYNII